MRKPVIAGNWKLYKTAPEALELVSGLMPLISGRSNVEVVVAPVFTVIDRVRAAIAGSGIFLAAQDCFWEEEGAFTGEVSPKMLADVGCSHVIVGHSERRQFFAESDAAVNKKIRAAVGAGLTVIFCIGETLEERESGNTFNVLSGQVSGGLEGMVPADMEKVIVAYEPVWAIGTGRTASETQAQEAHAFIRSQVSKLFNAEVAQSVRILYGGSVKPENIGGLIAQPDIDGALVGGASLKPDSFAALVNAA